MNNTDYIAVFDSGVGGISVLRQLVRLMPGERFLYYGDSKNAPYGVKNPEEVKNLTFLAVDKLISMGIKALVIACNTATALAIDALRESYPELIIVGIEPAVKLASAQFPGGNIGVMATPATIESARLRDLEARQSGKFIPLSAPGLMELVEKGADCHELLEKLLKPHIGKLDALVLGCTHYPFAEQTIRDILGQSIPLFDGGEGTARETRRRLKDAGLLREGQGEILFKNSAGDFMLPRCYELLNRP